MSPSRRNATDRADILVGLMTLGERSSCRSEGRLEDPMFCVGGGRAGVDSSFGRNSRLVQPGPAPENTALCRSVKGSCVERLAGAEASPMFPDPFHLVGAGSAASGSLLRSINIDSYFECAAYILSGPSNLAVSAASRRAVQPNGL